MKQFTLSKLRSTLYQPSSSTSTRAIINLSIIITLLLLFLNKLHYHHGQAQSLQPQYPSSPTRIFNQLHSLSLQPTSAQRLPTSLSQAWLSRGTLPVPVIKQIPASLPIDLLWTWTNGSDSNLELQPPTEPQPAPYLYRQHDELRYSLRSSLQSLPSSSVRSRIIITADQPNPGLTPKQSRPQWLLPTSEQQSSQQTSAIFLRHHSHIFRFIDRRQVLKASQWLKDYLPSHNSLAIESQFGHLDDIQDNLLYLNDDCFFFNKFSLGDFSSELFGPVFRVQFDLKVADDPVDHSGTESARGEWPSLGYSNHLLSLRFGRRKRRYLCHLPKVINIQITREVAEIWKEEIFLTASSRFRGQRREINMMFLATWYHIEKHREAMLHSFIMLQTDSNQDGKITTREMEQMMKRIGAQNGAGREMIEVPKPFRPRRGIVEDGLGEAGPAETDYEWLSSDGYPLMDTDPEQLLDYRQPAPASTIVCRLNLTDCFPRSVTVMASEKLLRRVASERPECGDCLLALLVGQSPAGMDALLPPRSHRTRLAEWIDSSTLATKPFSSFHKHAFRTSFFSSPFPRLYRFSRRALITDDPRIWAIRNIQRYQYVLGNTPSEFKVLTTLSSSRSALNYLTQKFNDEPDNRESSPTVSDSTPASLKEQTQEGGGGEEKQRKSTAHRAMLVTINDRIFGPHLSLVHDLFTNWLNKLWPTPSPWEKN